jgi:signal transduction histidine kinase
MVVATRAAETQTDYRDAATLATLLAEQTRLAEAATAALTQRSALLSELAHDLKSPLTVITGMVQLLQRQPSQASAPPPADLLPRFRQLEQAAAQLTGMVNELVALAQVPCDQDLPLQRAPTDLAGLLRGCVSAAQQLSPLAAFRLEVTTDAVQGVWDAVRLGRVVTNLLSNATKYSPPGSTITVALGIEHTAHGRWAVLRVVDQGMGIPALDLPHIFERCYRASNVAGRIEGRGIGLAGSRRMVEQHGGTLALESTEGTGTTVTVRLPLPT